VTGTSGVERPAARIGILGGTFNPPHLGHLALARHAREELGLARVLLMPAHSTAHKPREEDPGAGHRLGMCRLLLDDAGGLSACALEVERGGPSYTVDTLQAMHAIHPDAALTFIAGADTAQTLPAWRQPLKLLTLADLAVAARAGSARERILDAVGALGGEVHPRFLDMPLVDISSSMVRTRVGRGEPIDDLVGSRVAGYIAEHGLYRGGREARG
jgi:nicotinate-nucleotide adenylyltransferase